MVYRIVLFLLFLFCQISSRPDDSIEMDARRKGSSAVRSSLIDLTSERFPLIGLHTLEQFLIRLKVLVTMKDKKLVRF